MKNILILVCLTVLVPTALPLGNYPVSAKNSSWVQIQGPTISGGIISHLLVDPIDPDHLFAFQKHQDGKYVLFESQDGAVSWNPVYAFTRRLFIEQVAIDPSNPSILYASKVDAILRSVNGGRDWVEIAEYGSVIAAPAANTLYSLERLPYDDDCPTGFVNFAASYDRGDTWVTTPLGCEQTIHQISTTPSHPSWIYIRAENGFNSKLFRSNDGGSTWTSFPLTGPYFTHGFQTITIDPVQPEKLYSSSGEGIIVSADGGLTWRSVLNTSPVWGHFYFAFSNGIIYAGLDAITGDDLPVVYRSSDGGESWETLPWKVPSGLHSLQAGCCSSEGLFAALDGHGVYRSIDGGDVWQEANAGMASPTIVERLAVVNPHL